MTSDAGRSITYTSFNMTAQVTQGAATTALAYDPDHQRIRMDNGASFTFYLNDAASGAMTERVNASGTITWKSYLIADAISVAVLVPARVSPGRRLIRSFPDPPPVRGH